MGTGVVPRVAELSPHDAWNALEQDSTAALIDVRTQAEWTFVGIPDLESIGRSTLLIEWASFPGMSRNPRFTDLVLESFGGEIPDSIFFICRSGARSLNAAEAVAEKLSEMGSSARCINVAEGFEGDLDSEGHRGRVNGWKVRGLAWRQS